MTLTSQDFVAKRRRVTTRERQACQEHFLDLCHLVGQRTRSSMRRCLPPMAGRVS
jgi:hypothetical protein